MRFHNVCRMGLAMMTIVSWTAMSNIKNAGGGTKDVESCSGWEVAYLFISVVASS